MKKMEEMSVSSFLWFFNQCRVYFSIQLGRCVLFSFAALFAVLLLRRSVLKKRIFLKGMAWSIFLTVPFVGKLELFYNNALLCRLFLWWNNGCIRFPVVSYGYLLGIAVSGVMIVYQRRKLKKQMKHMTQKEFDGKKIYVSELPVTPFAAGVLCPKVVVPKVMEDTFETEELRIVLLHERTHIRLGHLWVYLLWDILRALLWMNPLLTCCMRYLKEDMEDICDRVVVQKKGSAYEYGQVLLKSVKLLKAQGAGMSATLIGEKDYQELKQRITRIAEYKPYQKSRVTILCLMCLLSLAGIFMMIKNISYPKYLDKGDVGLVTAAGEYFHFADNDILKRAFQIDGKYVYIDRLAFKKILRENGINKDIEGFWLGFGTYIKLPGIGSTPNVIYVDYSGNENQMIIPYVNREKSAFEYIFKYIL